MKKVRFRDFIDSIVKGMVKEMKMVEDMNEDNEWKFTKDITPEDDEAILVSWVHSDGRYSSPLRAYYCKDEEKYFLIDSTFLVPIDCDMWIDMPTPMQYA